MTTTRIPSWKISLTDLYACLVSTIEQDWRPDLFNSEREYHDDLEEFLAGTLPGNAILAREYMHAGGRVDLFASLRGLIRLHEIFFELKHDLQSQSDFDRLVGQLERIDPQRRSIILLLCGNTRREFVARLHERYSEFLNPIPPLQPSLAIIKKNLTDS